MRRDRLSEHARFVARYGSWALITGAAQGMGRAFADELGRRGLDLLLVDRQAEALAATSRALAARHGVTARPLVVDLASDGVEASLSRAIDEVDGADGQGLGLLVCSAAEIPIGAFTRQSLPDKLRALAVNCRAPLVLCDLVARRLCARGRGGLILLSSLSGRQGTPLVATYAATKAFNAILAESLWSELRGSGVDALAVVAGLTDTDGYRGSGANAAALAARTVMPAERVVSEALAALGRGPVCVPGRGNRLTGALMQRLLPRRLAAVLLARSMAALYPDR